VRASGDYDFGLGMAPGLKGYCHGAPALLVENIPNHPRKTLVEMSKRSGKLLERVRYAIRLKHYSIKTEQAYVSWVRRFILFQNKRHPKYMGEKEIEAFLTHLAVDLKVAASTQNQAFNALLFLYRNVLQMDLPDTINARRAKRPQPIPTVMTKEEVKRVIGSMSGTHQIMAKLLYGSGLRLMECVRLRVKDLDFEMNQVVFRDGKGMKDRTTMLPETVQPSLDEHLTRVRALHGRDLAKGIRQCFPPPRA